MQPADLLPSADAFSSLTRSIGQLECLSIYIFSFGCAYNVPTAVVELREE